MFWRPNCFQISKLSFSLEFIFLPGFPNLGSQLVQSAVYMCDVLIDRKTRESCPDRTPIFTVATDEGAGQSLEEKNRLPRANGWNGYFIKDQKS